MQENPSVTAAEIARLAGVGRAAVSNWRKRYAQVTPEPDGATAPLTMSIAELARTEALQLIGPVRVARGAGDKPLAGKTGGPAVLTVLSSKSMSESTTTAGGESTSDW